MKTRNRFVLIISFILAAMGFLIPFWPLELLGIALLSLLQYPIAGVLLALLLDIAYGPPPGVLAALQLPFTLFALLCFGIRIFAKRVLLTQDTGEKV